MRMISGLLAVLLFVAAPAAAQDPMPLNPNTATAAQLAAVPHLTPALVQEIVAKRPLGSPTALDAILAPSLSATQRQQIYPLLFVPMNLNTASVADINLVPGMTVRMIHEFREYRPYRSIDQFRAEIGKYVDKNEVARFERYIFVPAQ
jgi:DNA uptake protein ComE-like DNA-binding protein